MANVHPVFDLKLVFWCILVCPARIWDNIFWYFWCKLSRFKHEEPTFKNLLSDWQQTSTVKTIREKTSPGSFIYILLNFDFLLIIFFNCFWYLVPMFIVYNSKPPAICRGFLLGIFYWLPKSGYLKFNCFMCRPFTKYFCTCFRCSVICM